MSILKRIYLSAMSAAAAITVGSLPLAFAANDLGGTGDVPLGSGSNGIRSTIITVLQTILSFLALLAVIFIIVAGIRLIVSQGEDEAKEKAKKTIIYVVVGLIVVLIAKIFVNFAISVGNGTPAL